jgi:hypothetical protein
MPDDVVPLPAPGSLTVPLLSGWEGIVVALLVVLAVGVGFLVVGAVASGRRHGSSEWEDWLEGRSRSRLGHEEAPGADAPADAVPDPLGGRLRR